MGAGSSTGSGGTWGQVIGQEVLRPEVRVQKVLRITRIMELDWFFRCANYV